MCTLERKIQGTKKERAAEGEVQAKAMVRGTVRGEQREGNGERGTARGGRTREERREGKDERGRTREEGREGTSIYCKRKAPLSQRGLSFS